MPINGSVKRRLEGDVFASKDDVLAACQSTAASLNRSWNVTTSATKVTIEIGHRFIVGVTVAPGRDGAVRVQAKADSYSIRQPKVLFVIPAGPKMAPGAGSYNRYLDALETKLQALDDGRGKLKRVEP